MSDFESFTREKIARLRADADALEKILKEFQADQARRAGAARRSGPDQPRAGAFGVVMEAIRNAGHEGLTLDQMIEAAEAEGYSVKRPTLRSQIFQAKTEDHLIQIEPGRYRVPEAGRSALEAFGGVNALPAPPEAAEMTGAAPLGGFQTGPRESFSADLDDEIPF